MIGLLEKYVRVLDIELDDLTSHLDCLLSDYQRRRDNREISEHVLLENAALLKNEARSIQHFKSTLAAMDLALYPDLDALVANVKTQFEEQLKKSGLASAAYLFALRKIIKVRDYVEADDTPPQ